jgi:hypothetical protein
MIIGLYHTQDREIVVHRAGGLFLRQSMRKWWIIQNGALEESTWQARVNGMFHSSKDYNIALFAWLQQEHAHIGVQNYLVPFTHLDFRLGFLFFESSSRRVFFRSNAHNMWHEYDKLSDFYFSRNVLPQDFVFCKVDNMAALNIFRDEISKLPLNPKITFNGYNSNKKITLPMEENFMCILYDATFYEKSQELRTKEEWVRYALEEQFTDDFWAFHLHVANLAQMSLIDIFRDEPSFEQESSMTKRKRIDLQFPARVNENIVLTHHGKNAVPNSFLRYVIRPTVEPALDTQQLCSERLGTKCSAKIEYTYKSATNEYKSFDFFGPDLTTSDIHWYYFMFDFTMFYPTILANMRHQHTAGINFTQLMEKLSELRDFWETKNQRFAKMTKNIMNSIIGLINSEFSVLADSVMKYYILGTGRLEIEELAKVIRAKCVTILLRNTQVSQQDVLVMNYQTDSILVGFPYFVGRTKDDLVRGIRAIIDEYLAERNKYKASKIAYRVKIQYDISHLMMFNVNKYILLLADGNVVQKSMLCNEKGQTAAVKLISNEFWKDFIEHYASTKTLANFKSPSLELYRAEFPAECTLVENEFKQRVTCIDKLSLKDSANDILVKIPKTKARRRTLDTILLVSPAGFREIPKLKTRD